MRLPRLRLSIRALLALVLVFGGGLGWIVHRAHVQRDAVAVIVRSGGRAYYDWDLQEISTTSGSFLARDRKAKPRWPKWLVDTLGPDYLGDVRVVDVGGPDTDTVLASVARLKRLDGLHVWGSSLTDAGMAHLGGHNRLRDFSLRGPSKITRTGLESLRGMVRLERLSIYDVPLADNDLVPLEGLVNVRYLSLRNSRVATAGLTRLGRMIRLTTLYLDGSRIEDLTPIRHLAGLEILSLRSSLITDAGLAGIEGLTKLESIRLDGNLRLTDAGMTHLRGLSRLTNLNLDGTQVGDAGLSEFSRLARLTTLRVGRTRITNAGLIHLGRLPALGTLDLSGTQVTDAGLVHLGQSPSLSGLILNTTRVTDAGLTHLAGLRMLRALVVQKTMVTDEGIADLKKALPQLQTRR